LGSLVNKRLSKSNIARQSILGTELATSVTVLLAKARIEPVPPSMEKIKNAFIIN